MCTCARARNFDRRYDAKQSALRCLADGQSVTVSGAAAASGGGGAGDAMLSSSKRGEDHTFAVDRVFRRGSTQEEVFEEVSELVQSALDGCVVAAVAGRARARACVCVCVVRVCGCLRWTLSGMASQAGVFWCCV